MKHLLNTVAYFLWLVFSTSFLLAIVVAVDMYFAYRELGPIADQVQKVTTDEKKQQNGLHLPHEELGWIVNKNSHFKHELPGNFSVTYTTDADGFRNTPHRPHAQHKMYFFGDSFTFGHGVEDEQTFASIVARAWLDNRFKTVNVGANGYGITQMYGRFLEIENLLQAGDLVVFTPISKDLLRSYKDFAVAAQYLFSYGNNRLEYYPYFEDGKIKKGQLDTFANRLKGLLFHAPLTGKVWRKLHRSMLGPVDFNDAKMMFNLVKKKAEAKGAKFRLYFLPQVKDLRRGRYKYDVSMYNYAKIWDYFPSGEIANEKIGFPDDGHWNCHGHEIAAYAIVKTLIEDNYLNQNYLQRSIDSMPNLCENEN